MLVHSEVFFSLNVVMEYGMYVYGVTFSYLLIFCYIPHAEIG